MAEAILSDLVFGLTSKVGSLLLNEIVLSWGVKDEFDKLKTTVSTIEAVLLHGEQLFTENPQVKNWLGMLSEAIYDADDLLDEFSTEVLRQQAMAGSKTAKKVRLFFSSSNQFAFRRKMGQKVKDLRVRLDEIAANRRFHLDERSYVERGFMGKGRGETHSSPPQVVIGRDHDKEAIIQLLLSSDHEKNVSVVPIVGIGGLGKTTLAQLVFNDDTVKNHFELKMWVCVSEDFDVPLLVKNVIESASKKAPSSTQMDALKNLLHEKINGRRYLLTLDDVWNEDVNKWSSLEDLLSGGARGSKILITTRLRTVANMSRPIAIHELRGLSENEGWSLFEQMAFKQGQVLNPIHEAIGREIVAKCGGVPLAIKTIAGMLYHKELDSEWLLFRNEELSKIDLYKNDILPILKLSYNHLPSHYKHCFAYCSLYPKDTEICVKELILVWKAQGYLRSTDSNQCLQDVGLGYFMDLSRMSFFQDVQKDGFGNIESCKMHDLIHDLAILVAGDNFSTCNSKTTCINGKTRHLSFVVDGNSMLEEFPFLLEAKKTRTLLPFRGIKQASVKEDELHAVFCNLRCLRMLNLSDMGISFLPSSIYKLKHLRHLDISSNNDIERLPDSITDLYNLQVLNLCWCSRLTQLPESISKLGNLVHLVNYLCDGLTHMPRGIGQLTRLENLPLFVIAKDNSISKRCGGLDELHALNNLRDELRITNLRYAGDAASEFNAAELDAKQHIQKLELDWNQHIQHFFLRWNEDEDDHESSSPNDAAKDEMGLEALRPHQNLKELGVISYRGLRPPSWLPSLSNLVSISFNHCKSIKWLPAFDKLPYLKRLDLCTLTDLERIEVAANGGSFSFFPSLTDISLTDCSNLKGFLRQGTDFGVEELPCFPCVSELRIGGCPKLAYMPHFPELKKLILGVDGVKSLKEILKKTTTSASPFTALSQLQHLKIIDEEEFPEDELLQYLTSLQQLECWRCGFKSDEKDGGVQWRSLQVLNSVSFWSLPNLVPLPKWLQYVTTLTRLNITSCLNLVSIPEWMDKLNALQYLAIDACPKLSDRCNNNQAEDWPKISHIPNISVDWKQIQRNGCYLL